MMAVPALRSPLPEAAHRRRASHLVIMAVVLGLPLGGCSFDLGSWGSDDKPKQAAAADKPAADTITPQDINSAKDHATRGQMLAHSGKVDEAQAEFEQALTADPYNIQALYGRGLIYQGRGQHQQAIDDFTAASGLSPQKAEPLVGRATSYLALDKAKQAVSDLDEAVQADPSNVAAWSARGQAYERLGDRAKAAASYNRALALRPNDGSARSGLARTGG
ncbi:tetratricopeptide repeat protein [Bradyrhizobium erythrophlei]|uniref:Tetratricopeptide repeat-containing protein n=1 Tax=Bradyrhizobium erythrophlei TaxID=1437360 RepID=A0A1H5EQX9_9BRAD|nr:tetratricopeptide repeat protein [Bradyrhizobium erythrophlei]SED93511.1 Tetratricopeptide repeat-containing protein [Bradyrhizobium erythrophlei]